MAGEEVHGFDHTLILWIGGSRMAPIFCRTMQRAPSGVGKRQPALNGKGDHVYTVICTC